MNVVYFAKTSERGPSSRYRIYQFLPYLERAGIHCAVRPLFGRTYFALLEINSSVLRTCGKALYVSARFVKRIWDLVKIGKTEVVVIEGQLFPYCPPWIERVLTLLGKKLVVEFDDAIYLTPGHGRKIPSLLRLSAAAIVGNSTLGKYASVHQPNVVVVPTVVDTDRFRPGLEERPSAAAALDRRITIVWIGLGYNFRYIRMLLPTLRELQKEYRIVLRIISSDVPVLPGVDVEFRPWSYESEVQDLQTANIGVMPLLDDEWGRGKCGLKLLQYMAVGLPAVASAVGVNCEIVRARENGFLARTEEDWYRQLAELCRNPELRRRMGEAARETVVGQYSLKQWGPALAVRYARIIEDDNVTFRSGPVAQSIVR
jgi:glycosyltransferase involved in cell wall biosynthesis